MSLDGKHACVSNRQWVLILCADALMLCTSNLVFAYSSFKLDLKMQMSWDEPKLSIVWSFANAGMNFMVHLGWLYDRYGAKVVGAASAFLKIVGLGGMMLLAAQRNDRPFLFGACFFLDAQATAWCITLGQSEALRVSPTSRAGTAVSVAKTAFAIGPIVWTNAYQRFFSSRIADLFLCSGILGSCLLVAFISVISTAAVAQSSTKSTQKILSLKEVFFSIDCVVLCGAVSVVTWGSALVWISNVANFAVAAGYQASETIAIQSSFFAANMGARLAIGPLMDSLPLAKHVWVLLASVAMLGSSALMFVSGGAWLPVAAVLAGASFGADASMQPIMCRLICPDRQATLYAVSKLGGLISSTGFIWFAGFQAERYAAGAANCVGSRCYQLMWTYMLVLGVPAVCVTAMWALRARERAKAE